MTIKDAIAQKAVQLVENGMTVGLGTGTTAAAFITALARRVHEEQLSLVCVATSYASEKLASSLGMPCTSIDAIQQIDLTFDGADEVDAKHRLIKGAGGALLREKIVAYASKELIILVEEKKCVDLLGHFKLPVEITPFGYKLTIAHLTQLGVTGMLRHKNDGSPFITDNFNFIYDIQLPSLRLNPEEDDRLIRSIPGVVETGFFLNLAGRIIVGRADNTVSILERT